MNQLQQYFENNDKRLIYKYAHYFDIYDRHFSRFKDTDVHMLEIGVNHGGSLQMWKDYFGKDAHIYGVDICTRCKELEEDQVEIFIGSQEDPEFLTELKQKLPRIDILLDDGGHTMKQQITTFEEMFSHVSENGVYMCEDLHTSYWEDFGGGYKNPNSYIEYSKSLIDYLNAWHSKQKDDFFVNDFSRSAYSMHYYDSILAIEKKPMSVPTSKKTGHFSF
ncbi:MAG: class I SAM-dependent methyltransferase [Cyanobacteria bacterium J06649_11]